MNKPEVGALLTIASGFDRFIVADNVTTTAWHMVLGQVDFEEAKGALLAHFTGPLAKEVFSVRHILNTVADTGRNTPAAIEADVRSAKARGLIDKSWPARDRLPDNVREALFSLRDIERRAAGDMYELEQGSGMPADVGTVGRFV